MQAVMKLTTTVLPGRRIEFDAPELPEGTRVELIVLPESPASEPPPFKNIMEFIEALPPSGLTMEDWERIEREFREERDSWGD